MHEPKEIQARLERILPTVQKPGRYTGGELNQVVKDWDSVDITVAMVFPDLYDLGMSNLGLAILYDLVNNFPIVWIRGLWNNIRFLKQVLLIKTNSQGVDISSYQFKISIVQVLNLLSCKQ